MRRSNKNQEPNVHMILRSIPAGAALLAAAGMYSFCLPTNGMNIVFQEDFSSDLSAWTGKGGGAHAGQIVDDPLRPGNRVLSFTGTDYSGNIFNTTAIPAGGGGGRVILTFDYLGLAQPASVPGNLGGFLGVSQELNPVANSAAWIAGTQLDAVNGLGRTGIEIADDGLWHSYSIDLTAMLTDNNIPFFRLMLEDWRDAGGVAGDVYFDNLVVAKVSDGLGLASAGLGSGALLLLLARMRPRLAGQSPGTVSR